MAGNLKMSHSDVERATRALLIDSVAISREQLEDAKQNLAATQVAFDAAVAQAVTNGIEVRLLASLTGLSVQAIYQARDRRKKKR